MTAEMLAEPPRLPEGHPQPENGSAGQPEGCSAAPAPGLELWPVSFREASAFVERFHRHHTPPRGMKFAIGVASGDELVGVVMVGRPVNRHLDDGLTLEVNRSCTTGHKNVNSMLYAAAWRATKALGYRRLVTYTRSDESGSSLRAAGWTVIAERAPRKGWSCPWMWRADTSTEHGVQRMLWEAP